MAFKKEKPKDEMQKSQRLHIKQITNGTKMKIMIQM